MLAYPIFNEVYDVQLVWGEYDNGNVALRLMNEEDGPIATASTNTGVNLPDNVMAVKDYAENEGMADWLLNNGIIHGNPLMFIPSGHVSIPVYELV